VNDLITGSLSRWQPEKSGRIRTRGLAKFDEALVAQFGHEFAHDRDEGRLVGPSPVRHGRQERTVGLDVEPVQRHRAHRLTKQFGVLERDDPGDRDVTAQLETGPRVIGRAGETVHDGALGYAFALQKFEEVVEGVAGVDDEGEVQLVRQRDLAREGSALVGAR